ncbi:Mam3p NDAI_0G02940 [Naumovozyma dairenensis CBS 421]|uniref:CNNM transmembrane domain-containing protein n=1 Tax=Naumovozyma dairenensis (strain ATCC 10597 / BCRC 20456 / CBS 421 / NBRC 0211 / NRRL Y-12639) TaxID=1071378 RepID=G0WE60_NAUDC|nr:hypothetical protein NDAI_0G02940 [Naumovozyma dairenensis CBS 421]CCD26071.2 hypothetical protein NDAI_0G02940 [Naumovozyma dairenensis CBS 421]
MSSPRTTPLQSTRLILIGYLLMLIPKIYSLPLTWSRMSSMATPSSSPAASPPPYEDTTDITTYGIISAILVVLGGVFAGLTLGLMGQDEVYLKVISTSGTPTEKKLAARVLSLISRGKHWVLVTLLLSNVITNETLPIVLDRCLGGGWQAVLSSTVLIVIFGEIIPQSICVKYGLQVGAFFSPFVLLLMYVMYPVAYPIATLLDYLLGEDHGTIYKKSGLKTLVTLHRTMGVERLTQDEVTIISAVLDLKEKSVKEIMTPIENVFTMSAATILDDKTVELIFNSGFSRIPIYLPNEPNNFIGMLLVRVLISYDPDDALPVSHFPLATLPETSPNTSCLNILNYFQEGKSHMCIVSKDPGSSQGAIGVLTLEDVIEELIGEEIVDESDVFVDIHQHIMRSQPGPLSKRHITSYLHHLYTDSHRKHQQDEANSLLEGPQEQQGSDNEEGSKKRSESQPLLHTPNNSHDVLKEGYSSTLKPSISIASPTGNGHTNHYRSRIFSTPSTSEFQQHNHSNLVLPSNLASNPLDIKKPFVTIKKPVENIQKLTDDENALLKKHAKLAHGAMEYASQSGEAVQVTTSMTTNTPTKDITTPANSSSRSWQSSDPKTDNKSINSPRRSPINKNVTTISSSYQSTKNGIVESVITVKGVPKTIIEPAHNWDDSSHLETTGSDRDNISQRLILQKSPSSQIDEISVSPNTSIHNESE